MLQGSPRVKDQEFPLASMSMSPGYFQKKQVKYNQKNFLAFQILVTVIEQTVFTSHPGHGDKTAISIGNLSHLQGKGSSVLFPHFKILGIGPAQ